MKKNLNIAYLNGAEGMIRRGGASSGGGSDSGSGSGNVSKIEFVDLGLPSGTLWAKANLGAIHPAQQGLMYAWGELEGHVTPYGDKKYTKSDYKFYDSESGSYTKYNKSDGLTSLMLEDDAAYQYDNTCRTPTVKQVRELINNTNYEFISIEGFDCIKLTANNGNYICLPIYSSFVNGDVEGGSYTAGCYMTTGLSEDTKDTPKMVILNGEDAYTFESDRYKGMMIRPVQNK
jgi:hypothetical protein